MSGSDEGLCLPTDAEAEAEAAISANECNQGIGKTFSTQFHSACFFLFCRDVLGCCDRSHLVLLLY